MSIESSFLAAAAVHNAANFVKIYDLISAIVLSNISFPFFEFLKIFERWILDPAVE